jgi:Na+-transporting NADH:ubiquinone oxidoreductase subunit NqrB
VVVLVLAMAEALFVGVWNVDQCRCSFRSVVQAVLILPVQRGSFSRRSVIGHVSNANSQGTSQALNDVWWGSSSLFLPHYPDYRRHVKTKRTAF